MIPRGNVWPGARPRSKYGARKTVVQGQRFDSKREATRHAHLTYLEKCGDIRDLERQPVFPLFVPPLHAGADATEIVSVGRHLADFRYFDARTQAWVVEDAKGVRTATYRLKKRMVEALYGIEIREV